MNHRSEIEWAPRVTLAKVRALYVNEARGTIDDELVEEVGFGLFARCASILEYTTACEGCVACKRCARAGRETIIARRGLKPSEVLECPVCGWRVEWRVYVKESEKVDGQLHAGNARAAFERYLAVYPQCATREEKILAIDRLIHEFHWVLIEEGKSQAWKPAGVNLLRGSSTQVVEMLNQLTYGEHTPAELVTGRVQWKEIGPYGGKR